MSLNNIITDVVSTIVGGVFLALLFFWVREKFFPFPDVMGRWYFTVNTTKTAYRPYEGMVLTYMAMLWREGTRVQGTVEKIFEDSSTGRREFVGKDRTRGIVEGFLEKKYFSRDGMVLHVVEKGHGRESTNFYKLKIFSRKFMSGEFSSMVANQEGNTEWKRENY